MKYILSIFLLLYGLSVLSQEKIYIDENFKSISLNTYKQKCKRSLFKCLEYKTDSLVINKILFKYKFGYLDSTAYNQVRNLLIRDSKRKIPNNSTIVIKYYDSIFSFDTEYNKHVKHEKEYEASKKDSSRIHKEIFESKRSNWILNRNKCLKKFDGKYDTKIFHMFKHKDNGADEYDSFQWIEDKGTFKNVFFPIMYNYGLLLLKPDGEYFLSGWHLSDKMFNKLIKNTDWSKYKNDLINEKGMFSKEHISHYKEHCF